MMESYPMSENKEKFHEYDGIIEHDNPLPTWWLWTFFLTIIFAFIYFLHYEVANGPTLKAAFSAEGIVNAGKAVFESKCTACHGQELQGLIGPNLTDKFWIHGGNRMDIVKVIREGVSDKGMPPWGPILKKEEVYSVTAYILSKQGSNPAGAKAPEGQEFNP
jgi:cytochrome c oxidase cbb3-type subunit 3